jgi:hypothetical protein
MMLEISFTSLKLCFWKFPNQNPYVGVIWTYKIIQLITWQLIGLFRLSLGNLYHLCYIDIILTIIYELYWKEEINDSSQIWTAVSHVNVDLLHLCLCPIPSWINHFFFLGCADWFHFEFNFVSLF